MIAPPTAAADRAGTLVVIAWPRPVRWGAITLLALAVAGVLLVGGIISLDLLDGEVRATPAALTLLVVSFVLLPLGMVWLLQRTLATPVRLIEGTLHLGHRGVRFEVPLASVAKVRCWRLPAPGPGVELVLRSGRTFERALQATDLDALLSLLGQAERTQATSRRVTFASARLRHHRSSAAAYLIKFGAFPLLPAGIMFRVHQYIAYGGALGEYHTRGLGPYLATAFGYWSSTLATLVVFASLLRLAAEAVSLGAAWWLPGRAAAVRRGAEWGCRIAYYGGIPALFALRFLG